MTATPGLNVGLNQKLYKNSGTFGSPVWVLVTIAEDVALGLSTSKAEIKARVAKWVMTLPTFSVGPLTFNMIGDTSIAMYDTLKTAYMNQTLCDFAVADQAIANSGCEYFRAEMYLYKFEQSQKLEAAMDVACEADIAYSTNNIATPPAFTAVA
jgi:hypothetical protein